MSYTKRALFCLMGITITVSLAAAEDDAAVVLHQMHHGHSSSLPPLSEMNSERLHAEATEKLQLPRVNRKGQPQDALMCLVMGYVGLPLLTNGVKSTGK